MRNTALFVALSAGCLLSSPAAGAAGKWTADRASQARSDIHKNCPARSELDAALANASALMSQARNENVVALLEPLASMNCDARASLLLAAAFDGQGDEHKVIEVLEHAHSVWPSDNSIAASLARAYLGGGQKDLAAKALAHFHGAAQTPEQEMEMAVVVYLAADQLVSAERVADENYKFHPSVHSLLLMANTLQMQGRYPAVNQLLENKRATYADSPDFFITLGESEFDESLYPSARADMERAISLNSNLPQAHYILGNVLVKQGDLDRAVAEYRRAIELDPSQPRTYFHLALVLRTKNDATGEQHALEQALAADEHYAPANCELGKILMEQGRVGDAVDHLDLAVQYNPHSEEAYFLLIRAYTKLGERDKAQAMVKRLQVVRKANRPAQGK